MRSLRLGFSIADQSLFRTKSVGILNVSEGLLRSLAERPEFSEIVALTNSTLELPKQTPVKITARVYDAAANGSFARILWDQLGVYRATRAEKCDWLFLPKGYASFLSRPPANLAVYAHDAMHDFYHTHYPGSFPFGEEIYFPLCYKASLRNAQVVFTNSDFTSSEVRRLAQKNGLPEPRIVTAGIGFENRPVKTTKEEMVTMLVSRLPHKLTNQALDWLGRWQKISAYAGPVNLVGSLPDGAGMASFSNWKLRSRLSNDEFVDVLSRSRALIYFSRYEGFGMPPVEAILHGAAPVFSRIPAMEETTGPAGFAFDNDSYDSFARALNLAVACPPEAIQSWARTLMERHTWSKVAERIATALVQFPK